MIIILALCLYAFVALMHVVTMTACNHVMRFAMKSRLSARTKNNLKKLPECLLDGSPREILLMALFLSVIETPLYLIQFAFTFGSS